MRTAAGARSSATTCASATPSGDPDAPPPWSVRSSTTSEPRRSTHQRGVCRGLRDAARNRRVDPSRDRPRRARDLARAPGDLCRGPGAATRSSGDVTGRAARPPSRHGGERRRRCGRAGSEEALRPDGLLPPRGTVHPTGSGARVRAYRVSLERLLSVMITTLAATPSSRTRIITMPLGDCCWKFTM